MPKPRILDAELERRILTLARAGNFRVTIANAVGISRESLYAWCKDNPDFAEKMAAAESEAETSAVAKMLSSHDPKWALAWLERRYPTRWGTTERAKPEPEELQSDSDEATEELVNQRVAERLHEIASAKTGGPH